ncbi:MAG: hypothetical protein NWE90_04895 [Candidatus Bathyarchaeota archaeon]|nr:hypothetical protein [Candidatus Bathyarchaeota archaeon]
MGAVGILMWIYGIIEHDFGGWIALGGSIIFFGSVCRFCYAHYLPYYLNQDRQGKPLSEIQHRLLMPMVKSILGIEKQRVLTTHNN